MRPSDVISWFPRAWRIGGSVYAALTLLLAAYAFGSEHLTAFVILLAVTLPSSVILYVPIYAAVALVPTGYEVGVAVCGFVTVAVLNVVILRLLVLGSLSLRQRFWPVAQR